MKLIKGVSMEYREAMQILRARQLHAPAIVHVPGIAGFYIFSRTKMVSRGETIEAALQAGGFLPAPHSPDPFVAEDLDVRYKSKPVCKAENKTLALRIANALNEYVPGKRSY